MPIVVKTGHDLVDDPDPADYEFEEWLEDLLEDPIARSKVRRWIFINAFDDADAVAVQTILGFIRDQTEGTVISLD